jgi:hypothetical protein
MTHFLAGASACGALLTAVTALLIVLPPTPAELRIWRRLRLSQVRHWLTRRDAARGVRSRSAIAIGARRNLAWHLVLTGLFAFQLAVGAARPEAWWRPLAVLLVAPSAAYFLGSLVQRHKIAIVRTRQGGGALRRARR